MAATMACGGPGIYNPGDPTSEEYTLTRLLQCALNSPGSGCPSTGAEEVTAGPAGTNRIPGSGTPTFVDVSAGTGTNSGQEPSAVIDYASSKLLIATKDATNGDRLSLFRCNLDGGDCTYHDISAGRPADSARVPNALLDTTNNKLLVVTRDFSATFRLALYRCNPDGTGCAHADISAGAGANSGNSPSAMIDEVNGKILTATDDDSNGGRPGLFRCNLDGMGCVYTDISAGQGASSCNTPSIAMDVAGSKLLVVCANAGVANVPVLFRCNPDGTGCTYTDLSAGLPTMTGHNPAAVVDESNSKLLVVVRNLTDSGKPYLLRCELDGTACAVTDISQGEGANSASSAVAVLDMVNGKLLAATRNVANGGRPSLFRCNLDGTDCTHTDMSAGRGVDSGKQPSALIDTVNGRFLITTHDSSASGGPSLFWN